MNFGDKLKKLRSDKRKTQEEVAVYFNIAPNTWSNYENNKREPDIDMLPKIADYFGVTIDSLLYDTKDLSFAAYLDKDFNRLPDEAKKDVKKYIEFVKSNYKEK